MQPGGVDIDQIPPGAHARPAARPPRPGGPLPAGLYLRIASAQSQAEAVRSGLEFSARMGPRRPPVIRGDVAQVNGRPRIRLFAGPFASEADARAYCRTALPAGSACPLAVFGRAEPAGTVR